jgi:hypothetical protein
MPNLIVRNLQDANIDPNELYAILDHSSSWRTNEDERGLGSTFKASTRHPLVTAALDIDDKNKTIKYKNTPEATAALLQLAQAYQNGYGKGTKDAIDINPMKAAKIYGLLRKCPYAVNTKEDYIGQAYTGLKALFGDKGPLHGQLQAPGGKSVYELIAQRATEYSVRLAAENKAANDLKAQQVDAANVEAKEEKDADKPQVQVNVDADKTPALHDAPLFTPKQATASSVQAAPSAESTLDVAPTVSNLTVNIPGSPRTPLPPLPAVTPVKTPSKKADASASTSASQPTIEIDINLEPNQPSPVSQVRTSTSPVSDKLASQVIKAATPKSPAADKLASPVHDENKEEQAQASVAMPVPPTSPVSQAPAVSTTKPATPKSPAADKLASPVHDENKEEQAPDRVATPLPPTRASSPAPVTPKSPAADKLASPVHDENKEEQAPDRVATPLPPTRASSPAPVTPKSPAADKLASPVHDENKEELHDRVATPAPTNAASSSAPTSLFGNSDVPAPAQSSAPEEAASDTAPAPVAPAAPSFPKVDALLNKLNVIAAKHPASGATTAIKAEQMALFAKRTDKKTLLVSNEIKALSYDEAAYLSNHMNDVQLRKAVDTRFDHLRTETGSIRKHLGDGKGETTTWRELRLALKIQILLLVTAEAKAQQELEATQAAAAKAALAAATPVAIAPEATATVPATEATAEVKAEVTETAKQVADTQLKLNAARHAEVSNLLGQYAGRPYGIFGHHGKTSSQKYFNTTFAKLEPEVEQANSAPMSPGKSR